MRLLSLLQILLAGPPLPNHRDDGAPHRPGGRSRVRTWEQEGVDSRPRKCVQLVGWLACWIVRCRGPEQQDPRHDDVLT